MSRLLVWVGALALVAAFAAGCGGDGEETAAPAPQREEPAALGKQELLAQGDAICAEVNAAVGTVESTASQGAGASTQRADLYNGMVERLRRLGAPSDDDSGYEEFITAAERLAQAASDVRLAAERGDAEGLAAAESDLSAARDSFQSAAEGFGFRLCGEEPRAPSPAGEAPGAGGEGEEGGLPAEPETAPETAPAPETGGAGAGGDGGGGGAAPDGGGGGAAGGGGGSGGIGPG